MHRNELVERFFRYASIDSQSDNRSTTLPSTRGQLTLARLIAEELRTMGLEDVVVDDRAIVTAVKKATCFGAPTIGFIAHLDTADIGLSAAVCPQVLRYRGGDVCLNRAKDIWLREVEHPEISRYTGEEIVFSDGTSVLGADNKAAIAVIMTMLGNLGPEDVHGDILVAFVPDEEIGLRGARALDTERFECDFAYTIDCCELGELVLENFNAAAAEIIFKGVSAHPMSAKGVLVNPLLYAIDFVDKFDRWDTPEHTANKEGFFWFTDLIANDSEARLTLLIRDFDLAAFDERKRSVEERIAAFAHTHAPGSITYTLADTYHNIARYLEKDTRAEELLLAAFERCGIPPIRIAMRGGTDGTVLSQRGVPTPNFFTGAHNFHSPFEFLPLGAFERSLEVAFAICRIGAGNRWLASEKRDGSES